MFVKKKNTLNINTWMLEVKGQRKICHANINLKKAEIAVLLSHNADFRKREIIRERKYVMINTSILQENSKNPNCVHT